VVTTVPGPSDTRPAAQLRVVTWPPRARPATGRTSGPVPGTGGGAPVSGRRSGPVPGTGAKGAGVRGYVRARLPADRAEPWRLRDGHLHRHRPRPGLLGHHLGQLDRRGRQLPDPGRGLLAQPPGDRHPQRGLAYHRQLDVM